MTGWNDRHRQAHKGNVAAANQARREDLHFLADNGETREAAATRLGLTLSTLNRWCSRHDLAVWAQLGANGEDRATEPRRGRVALPSGKRAA